MATAPPPARASTNLADYADAATASLEGRATDRSLHATIAGDRTGGAGPRDLAVAEASAPQPVAIAA